MARLVLCSQSPVEKSTLFLSSSSRRIFSSRSACNQYGNQIQEQDKRREFYEEKKIKIVVTLWLELLKGLVAECQSFFIFHIFCNIQIFIQSHSYNTFIRRHSPGPLSISSLLASSVGKPPCNAEPRIELGPDLQPADELPTKPRTIFK